MAPKLLTARWISFILVIDFVFCQLNPESSGGSLEVAIAFNNLDGSINFFKNVLNPIFDDISKCVKWSFVPCSTTYCTCGSEECAIDTLHACAAHHVENDERRLGKFLLCMMTNDDRMIFAEKCAIKAVLNWSTLKQCQSRGGEHLCTRGSEYWSLLTQHTILTVPGVIFNKKYNAASELEALHNLKDTICKKIKEKNLQCAAC